MQPRSLWLAAVFAFGINAQSSTSDASSASSGRSGRSSGSVTGTPSIVTLTGSQISISTPTGSYKSLGDQITASDLYETRSSSSRTRSGSGSGSGSASASASTTSKGTTSLKTVLVGGGGIVTQSIINGTVTLSSPLNQTRTASGTRTGTASLPKNTQPCNNYPEFCDRKYGNVTEVVAHNAAFTKKGNAASNQELSVTMQLNDGIRMIQGEVHYVNDTLYSCHSNCDILNAGPYLDELNEVGDWVREHPYDIVTILIVNSVYAKPGNFSNVLQQSNLAPYLYEPPFIPMRLGQWPTYSELILMQKRVIVFMDYEADQNQFPYILDEFTHMWETPFSPVDREFPCTTQRPPNLDPKVARNDLMYLANHNLNTNIALFGTSLLIPNTAELNVTNAAGSGVGMLGAAYENCTAMWDRPPTWLLVDYYNVGAGSVFEVAARANNVTYNRKCCGAESSDAPSMKHSSVLMMAAIMAILAFVL